MSNASFNMDYTEDLLYYARDMRFRGTIDAPSGTAHRENPSCGDSLTFRVTIDNGQVKDIRFEGVGCAICLASAHLVAEHALGTSTNDVLAYSKENMVEWLSHDVGPLRVQCMMLGLLTLQDAVYAGTPRT